jgi:AAA15 family ATPase/GTPase
MLLQFSVKNFRSIKEWATISMVPLPRLDKIDGHLSNIFVLPGSSDTSVLKVGVIYGKNASGKSNLILALKAISYLVQGPVDYDEQQPIPSYEPYLFDESDLDAPCEMEVDFIGQNGFRYNYSLAYTKYLVISEKLVFYPKKQPALLFDRKFDSKSNNQALEFGPQFKGDRRFLREKNINNRLILAEFRGNEYVHTKEANSFFRKFIVATTRTNEVGSADGHDVQNLKGITRALGRMKQDNLENYNSFIENIVGILKAADTGIEGLEVNKVDSIEVDSTSNKEVYQVLTYHNTFIGGKKSGIKKMNLFGESTGTIKLFSLLNSIFEGVARGALIALDELDRSLHPNITKLIIQLIYKVATSEYQELKPNICPQLLFTTHDSSLLDKKLFRRDQIWFTDTDDCSATTLYCLAEIKGVRKDTPYSDWYLSGRFGGVPATSEFAIN